MEGICTKWAKRKQTHGSNRRGVMSTVSGFLRLRSVGPAEESLSCQLCGVSQRRQYCTVLSAVFVVFWLGELWHIA